MRRRVGYKAATIAAIAVSSVGLLGGCGSSGSSADKNGDVTTTAAASGQDGVTTTATAATGDADAGAKLTSGQATADHTVTITATAMSPSTLSIAKGDIVTFVGGESGVHAVIVPGLEAATVTKGLFETFEFPKVGTFVVTDDVGSGTVTINVS